MFVKGISTEDFRKNYLGESSNRSLQMRTMTVSERYPSFRRTTHLVESQVVALVETFV